MPIIQHNLPGECDQATFWLWHIEEPLDDLCARAALSGNEKQVYDSLKTAPRKAQWLVPRVLLRECTLPVLPRADGSLLFYDAAGGPVVENGFIGISHTGEYVAVVYGSRPCSVDIEMRHRDFSTAARRFIHPQERLFSENKLFKDDRNLFYGLLWCAKEAVYKWLRKKEVDFRRDIRLTALDTASNHLSLTFCGQDLPGFRFQFTDHLIIVASL